MNILVLNCGSSSVKFQLVDSNSASAATHADRKFATGSVDDLGPEAAFKLKFAGENDGRAEKIPAPDHEAAVRLILDRFHLDSSGAASRRVDAVGHRVVHGGDLFTAVTRLDDQTLARIESLNDLAPLHNPAAVSGIHAARKVFGPALPMAAVFDTAFHATIAPIAATYAIDDQLAKKHHIRRYGFHGMAHRYSLLRYAELSGQAEGNATIVTLHLGNGCSACAIRAGASADTSMGFTPLEGLVMGTRSGDVDAALVEYLARKENVSAAEVESWLNHRSGLLGLSGLSNDMRELLAAYDANPRARLAVEVFCYRARKYLGAYLAALGGAQAVIFSGGIGENAPAVREKICAGMEWCGLRLDQDKNNSAVGAEACISAPDARLQAYVIPSDEEAIIARETARLFESATG